MAPRRRPDRTDGQTPYGGVESLAARQAESGDSTTPPSDRRAAARAAAASARTAAGGRTSPSRQRPRPDWRKAIRAQSRSSADSSAAESSAQARPKGHPEATAAPASVDAAAAVSTRQATAPFPGASLASTIRSLDGQLHPLTDQQANERLCRYERDVKGAFDRIVPLLKRLSALQHEDDFTATAQSLARKTLGFELPEPILEKAWVSQLDMGTLFAWCVFETYQKVSEDFFVHDPLQGRDGGAFDSFLRDCGYHLLDITPCADGRLAHTISYALRIPFSSVRRRSHAGALFSIEDTVDRWVRTEHSRHREGVPNGADAPTHYLKGVIYHFSSLDPLHQGCAAHDSDDARAARCGHDRLAAFQQAIENAFCCGASVDLLLMGIDTDTDAIRVHVPEAGGQVDLNRWLDARDVYEATRGLTAEQARTRIAALVEQSAPGPVGEGMVRLISRLIEHNISQIDYVRQFHGGAYADAGHAERFIGVGIGFKEVHLRNLTYFTHLDSVEVGAADLDVGIRIFRGLNVSRGLPVPIVVRFDYSSRVPGARERAIDSCHRVDGAIRSRYASLFEQEKIHILLTVRDRVNHTPAEAVGSSLAIAAPGGH
ncbi:MAG: carboxysome shell carbonic anhydrase [Aphanocapsa feldmannii 277cV]|uniref:Carboxysome shell carbonic anhydrase n=2 Tax=Aphanocapsa feldmannii TaxID=192050 RepID=A0A524RKD7_9CHRO|nr:MAG: carboxysome shell carbonic anhydrase [Aphanocapsa feldmannii 288cV]TGG89964.1 MAG: carboxysome shell carbonic anhydrase [Aphanocapsa feldmannii 277cV]TGH23553.1 MAG: carboxysome shell carbonic anhydrase [Aphanocapsa feldmannii 277cI]